MEAVTEFPTDLQKKIIQGSRELVPPTNMDEAVILARGGEFVIDLLANQPVAPEAITAAIVRTAGLIGGNKAFELIARYRPDSRTAVGTEIVRAWSNFDLDTYVRKILANSPYAEELVVTDPTWVSQPGSLPQLRRVRLAIRVGLSPKRVFSPALGASL
jgi:hypothetical protein